MKLAPSICIGLVLLSPDAYADDEATPQPTPLAVVQTRAGLLAQPPVTIANAAQGDSSSSVTYRLGIDRTKGDLYGGVVLYCLAQGGKPIFPGRDKLGPFVVDVQAPQTVQLRDAEKFSDKTSGNAVRAGTERLYFKAVPLHQAGDYKITVQEPVGDPKEGKFTPVAAVTVKVSDQPGELWSPWPLNAAGGAVGLLARDEDRTYSADGVANPSTGVSIPKMPPWWEIGGDKPTDPDIMLPTLFPPKPDSGVTLQAAGSLLIVKLDHGMQPEFPDEKFLSRWWINGKPFIPKLAPPQFTMSYGMRHNGAWQISPIATEIGFEVEFHPEILGAKKGDSIGVQLLLSPQGFEYSGPEPMQEMALAMLQDDTELTLPRMSNRVNFTYTGDPIRMAPLH